MGADGWRDNGPWYDDPSESLRALQRQQLAQQYDFSQFVADRLTGVRQALDSTKKRTNDPPELREQLLEVFGADVAYLEGVQARPLPSDSDGQLEIVRHVCDPGGCGGVLDVRGLSAAGEFATARVLPADELASIFKTAKPTIADVRRHRSWLPAAGRAVSYCFPVYDDAGSGVAWHFYGRTFD